MVLAEATTRLLAALNPPPTDGLTRPRGVTEETEPRFGIRRIMEVWPSDEVSNPLPTSEPGAPGDEVLGVDGAVVVAVDGSAADEPVVDWAADEAARLGAPLRLVTVVDPQVQLTPYDALASGAPSLARAARR